MRTLTLIQSHKTVDGIAYRRCPRCEQEKPIDAFGLRRMAGQGPSGEDVIRNQSWCRACRSRRR